MSSFRYNSWSSSNP